MNLSQITIAPILPLWLVWILLLAGLGMTLLQYHLIRKKVGRSRALLACLLRLSAFSLLICFLLNPTLVERKQYSVSTPLTVLIDTSQTMGLSGHPGKGSRLDEAKALLLQESSPFLKSLSEKFEVRLFALGESLRALEREELPGLKPSGTRGDLTDALNAVTGKSPMAVLLSDGNLKWEGSRSTSPAIFTLPVGDPERYKDLFINAVRAPALAFRGREVVIDVTIKGYGYAGSSIPVLLKDGSSLLTAKTVRLDASPAEITVPLTYVPEEIGIQQLSVSIPPQYGEDQTSNNVVNLSLKVIRDKIRVLMVSGNPSLSYRFMRAALKGDPSIDLLSFVILRTPSDVMNVPLQEQSLIPFPVETLFSKELKNFDLLIFDNFPHSLYLNRSSIEGLKTYVKEGGGFAVIGGPSFSTEGGYGLSVMGDILPVRLTGKDNYRRGAPFGVRLNRPGRAHPVTHLSQDEGDNANLWEGMPPLDGVNLLEPTDSRAVLLESNDGASRPILVVGHYGKGRVLTLATDFSWKWHMGMVAKGKGNAAYLRLIERMVRWTTKDPSLDPVQIILPDGAGKVGQESEIRIKIREENLSPGLRGNVSLSVLDPEGVKIASHIKPAGQSGELLGSFRAEKGGTYKVRVDSPAGHQEESLVMTVPGEGLDGAPNHERLQTLSVSTGGKTFFNSNDLLKELEASLGKGQSRFTEERRLTLWSRFYIFAFILLVLAAEWYLRRKWGLL